MIALPSFTSAGGIGEWLIRIIKNVDFMYDAQ